MINDETLATKLTEIVHRREQWDVFFKNLTVHHEARFTEITYSDSGVGEEYVVNAFKAEWPDRSIDVDIDGGCDSCGYGRTVSITISGHVPPWRAS